MKIFAISDLHLSLTTEKPMDIFGFVWQDYLTKIEKDWKDKASDEDIILIAGDISWAMRLEEAIPDLQYLNRFPGTKIFIRGNHDYWWKSISKIRSKLSHNQKAIQNDALKIGNYVFCGSRGWQTPEKQFKTAEDKKIYDSEIIRTELSLKQAQALKKEGDKLICLMHYPPFNSRMDDSPFTQLFEKYKVDVVVYGHLHGSEGSYKTYQEKNLIKYYLTSCDIVGNKLTQIY